jgi:hypothetical protein
LKNRGSRTSELFQFSISPFSIFFNMVSPVGIEPTTNWLKANCSTTELRALVAQIENGEIEN